MYLSSLLWWWFQDMYFHQNIKLYTFNTCSLLYVNYSSIKFFSEANKQVVCFKMKHALTILSNCTLGHLSHKNENLCLHRNLCTNIHSSFIYQKKQTNELETTQISFSGWMTEQTLTYLYNGILFLKKKEQIIDPCNNLECVMFSDKRPPEKVTHGIIPLIVILEW